MGAEGIILAGGLSSRAGAYKMTLMYKDRTIIENVIVNMQKSVKRIIVVGGYRMEKLEPVIKKYKNVELVYNENYELGMFTSIKKGLQYVREEKFFLTPGDYPLIDENVYRTMLGIEGDIVIPTFEDKKGHPILIKSYFIDEILEEGRYSNLKEFRDTREPVFVPVGCRGILMDIDTMEDYINIIDSF